MTDPLAEHAAYLAALDRLIAVEREGLAGGRHVVKTLSNGVQVLALAHDETSPTLRGLEGRRRILERHAPEVGVDNISYCFRCAGQWPCPDWRDAAGLGGGGLPSVGHSDGDRGHPEMPR